MTNLNATNLIGLTPELIKEVEKTLGTKLTGCYTYKANCNPIVTPDTIIMFKPFNRINKDASFNENEMTLTVFGRNKWKRGISSRVYKLEVVGYKCNTTHKKAGYIYGNPVLIQK